LMKKLQLKRLQLKKARIAIRELLNTGLGSKC
jgi:hypothetical protein